MGDDSRYIEFSGTYPANELYVTESRNEDGCRELIYTDKEGKKILARSMNGTEKIDTYFVYDFAGRLAVVITPEGTNEATIQNYKSIAISSAFVDTYCYYYHYDSRGSVTTKHIPGGAYEEMNYDSYCRLWRRWRGAKNTYWDEKYLEQYSYDQLNRIKEVAILVMPISAGITSSTYTRNPVTMSAYIYDNYKGVPAALDESSNPAFVANPRGEKTYEKLLLLESNTQIAVLSYYTERAFYYDKEGRLRRCVELNHRGGRSTIDYEYDFQGHTTRRTERIQPLTNAPVDVLDIHYTYDHVGRLLTQTSTLNTSDPVTVTCTYNELGQLERKNINGLIMDYTYNLQGWLIGQDSPYYSAKLKYYDGEYPSYAGNITEWTWGGAGTMPHTYKYRYDNLARMTGAWYSGDEGAQNYSERAIAYDDNGNILRMVRNLNDQLAYTYKGNQLQSVNNEKFEYDNCGNIIKDERNDLNITYNFLNLPWQVYRISNPSDRTLYSYLPDGTKLSSVDQTGNGLYYVGSLVYTGGRTTARLESAGFGDGRFRATTSSGRCLPEYYLTDHLGSIRALCDHTGELIALRDYYAFGMEWERPNAPATTDRYYYNGKEKQEIGNTGLLDYGARFYNPDIGRWTTLDPLAHEYCNISPYAYCVNSPMNAFDWQGKLPIFINGFTFKSSEKGTRTYWDIPGGNMAEMIGSAIGDYSTPIFRDGAVGSAPEIRSYRGAEQAKIDFNMILSKITDENGNITETIKIFTHSMGGAYGKGYVATLVSLLEEAGYNSSQVIEAVYDFDPYQADKISSHPVIQTIQFTHSGIVAEHKQKLDPRKDYYIESGGSNSHSIRSFFCDFTDFINQVANLAPGEYLYEKGEFHKMN